jgi:hypothetical protein
LALYCAGDLAPTALLLEACPPVTSQAASRLAAGWAAAARARTRLDVSALVAEREELLG